MGFYWGPDYYNDFAAYKAATLHNGIYYLPEENGLYNDPGSAYSAFIAAGGGGGGLGGGSFSYPGQGFLLLQAVQTQDYPLMQGIFMTITFAVLGANWLVDIAILLFDPRTRK